MAGRITKRSEFPEPEGWGERKEGVARENFGVEGREGDEVFGEGVVDRL